MRSATYRSIVAAAFMGFAGVGLVWSAAPDADAWTGHLTEAMAVLGAPVSAQRVPLSDEERAQVFDGVMRLPDVPVAEVEPPGDGAPLPAWVALQDLPPAVLEQLPRLADYKFVKLDDRILLVNPASRKAVAEMPRYKLALQ